MNEFLFQQVVCSESTIVWVLQSTHEAPSGRSACEDVQLATEGMHNLSEPDADRWRRYRTVAKKNQFLMSRRAISFVLQEQFGADHSLKFVSLATGCPRLLNRGQRDVATVSLSHSQNVVVLGIDLDLRPIGVDCEIVESVVPNAIHRYLGEPDSLESAKLPAVEQQWRAAVRWTEFEARWKMLQNLDMMVYLSGDDDILSEAREAGVSGVPKSLGPLLMQGWSVDSSQRSLHVMPLSRVTNDLSPAGAVVCVCASSLPRTASGVTDGVVTVESLVA